MSEECRNCCIKGKYQLRLQTKASKKELRKPSKRGTGVCLVSNVSIEDMKSCIQEWFAQEYELVGLTNLYVEVRMEIDKQLRDMTNAIGKNMAENGLFDKMEG